MDLTVRQGILKSLHGQIYLNSNLWQQLLLQACSQINNRASPQRACLSYKEESNILKFPSPFSKTETPNICRAFHAAWYHKVSRLTKSGVKQSILQQCLYLNFRLFPFLSLPRLWIMVLPSFGSPCLMLPFPLFQR